MHVHACVEKLSGQGRGIVTKLKGVGGYQGGDVRQAQLYNHRLRAVMGGVLCKQGNVLRWYSFAARLNGCCKV